MPSDLTSTDPTITVEDRTGGRLPYSRGIMATSLLATGITTEDAYALASAIQRRLHASGTRRLTAEDLVELAKATLLDQPRGREIAARWMAWRAAKRTGRPVVIVLTGAPGVGKSTFATRLAVRLDITRVVTSDAIREVLRTVVPDVVLAELHRSTFEAVDLGAPDPFAGFDRQCAAVSAAMAAVVRRMATEHRSVIAEGVHLVPGSLGAALADHPASPIVIERVVTVDDVRHEANLRRREITEPLRGGDRHLVGFETIREIHRHLREAATEAGIDAVDAAEGAAMIQDIVDEIVARADIAAVGR